MALVGRVSITGRLVDGRYRVVRHLADGGMGSVFAAVDERLDRDVALKVMREDLARDDTFVERFRKEARSAARLSHPHVVAVHDQGEEDGLVFLAMEFVEGETLRDLLRREGALAPRRALDIAADVLAGLASAHRAGIVHRDVKPENVLIAADGTVKVADFGLARAVTTQTSTALSGTMLGTVAYLAPEQVERGIADARSDVYATGLLLHEMLTGRPAVEGESPIHVAYQHVHGDIPAPSSRVPGLPAALDALVAEATARDPDGRPADAGAFASRLAAVRAGLTDAQLDARPPGAGGDRAAAPGGPGHDTRPIGSPTAVLPRPAAHALEPERTRGRARRLLPAAVAGVLALLAGWFVLLGPGSARPVPDVAGRDQAAAQQALSDAGLRTSVTEQFSETVPRGDVVAPDPPAGEQATRWSEVGLAVSKGPERYDVPDLRGRDAASARAAIEAAHLSPGTFAEVYDEQTPSGQVVSTSPAPGTSLRPGSSVDVDVSKGRRPVEIEDWRGEPLETVRGALEPYGVQVRVSAERFSSSVPKGGVVEQEPTSGTLHAGDGVRVVVSKGPDLVTVPPVRGMSERSARARLEAAGFRVEVQRIAGGLLGLAQSTDPGGDKTAPRGGTVTLRIV